jgi:hypothetical protein
MKVKIFSFGVLLGFTFFISCQDNEVNKDAKKRLQLWQSKTDNGWKNVRKIHYTYNEDGRLNEERAERIVIKDSTENQYRVFITYNDDGKEKKKVREQWDIFRWTFAKQSTFVYADNKIVQRMDSIARGRGSVIDITDYKYGDQGYLIEEITYNQRDSLKSFPRKIVYLNDKNGKPIEKEFPIYRDDQWQKARKMILTYDENGNHIKTTRYNWRNNEWKLFADYELKVDPQGNRISELWKRPSPQSQNTEEFMRILYTYE